MKEVIALSILFCVVQGAYNYCQAPAVIPSENTDGYELVFVQVVSRHGDRTPTRNLPPVPNDNVVWECVLNSLSIPSNDTSLDLTQPPERLYRKLYIDNEEVLPGNCALGQLTEIGLNQEFALGAQLRELYSYKYNLLPLQWSTDDIYVRSTDVPRTIASAQSQLFGLYPSAQDGNDIQVIEINTIDSDLEYLYPNPTYCPPLQTRTNELMTSATYKAFQETMLPVTQQLQTIFNTSDLPYWTGIADVLHSRYCHNMPFPPGINSSLFEQIAEAANWEWTFLWNDPTYGILSMGKFTQEVINNFDVFIGGQTSPIWRYYSAHDLTVGPFLANLGLFDGLWPPYASNLQMELWKDSSNNYYVQMKYNGNVLNLPGCGAMCPYSTVWRPYAAKRTSTPEQCEAPSSKKKLYSI